MERIRLLHGSYLICPDSDPHNPKIYLLLDVEGETIGICVNREFRYDATAKETGPLSAAINILGQYEKLGWVKKNRPDHLPILDGGDAVRGMFVLHNVFKGVEVSDPISKMYQVTLLDDYLEQIKTAQIAGYVNFVYGFQRFNTSEISANVASGKWERRTGLHAMTYGTNLTAKARHIEALRLPASTKMNIGGFDIGNMMGGIMHLFKDVQPAMMHSGVISYLKSTNPTSTYEDNLRVLRMMIVVAESEGNDLAKVMKKYTHTEWVEKFNAAVEGGLHFKLLQDFDGRQDMLRDLGFDPFIYDFFTSGMFAGVKPGLSSTKKPSGSSQNLKRTLDKLAELAKSRVDGGGKA